MDSNAFKAKPFSSSLELNIALYIILTALNILISKFYLLELTKRHPLKFENDNQVKAGLVQSLFSLIPTLVFSAFTITSHHPSYLKSSYSSILLSTSLITSIAACKPKRVLLMDLKAIKLFMLLMLIAALSLFIIGSGMPLAISAFLLILLVDICLICKILNNPVTIGCIETEATEITDPNYLSTDILRTLLYPFEVILENLIIIPDSVSKPYSLNPMSKVLMSPISMCFLSIIYFNEALSVYSVLFMIVSSLCATLLLLASSKIRRIGYTMNLYSFFVCALLYYFLFDTSLEVASSIGNLINLSKAQVATFIISPQLVIPPFCIYKYFMRAGFYKRALYSASYSVILNLTITHFAASVILPGADFRNIFQSGDLRVSSMGILVHQSLIFANLALQKGRLQRTNCLLSLYILAQDYLITSFAAMNE